MPASNGARTCTAVQSTVCTQKTAVTTSRPFPGRVRQPRTPLQPNVRWLRSEEKCRFAAQSCCGTSQRCVRPRRRT
eukprot:1568906-Prymnesium_polylepis.1